MKTLSNNLILSHPALKDSLISLKGKVNVDEIIQEVKLPKLSKTSKKLMRALDAYLDDTLKEIRHGKCKGLSPHYQCKCDKDIYDIRPIYAQRNTKILFEKTDGKFTHRILVDKDNPEEFMYEKIVDTDYGTATLKSYNSKIGNDEKINSLVDDTIIKTLKKILPNKLQAEFLQSYRRKF